VAPGSTADSTASLKKPGSRYCGFGVRVRGSTREVTAFQTFITQRKPSGSCLA
jgi:hypothetical protein